MREPRVLTPSPSLLRALALCQRFATSIPVRGSRASRPTLSIAHLARLEEEIGARLHDDVLVLLALRDPVARLVTGISDVVSIADVAADFEAPDGYVRIATVYSDPIGELVEGAHGGPYVDLLVPREPEGDEAKVLAASDGHAAGVEAQSLGAFIADVIHDAIAGAQDALAIVSRGESATLDPAPRLVASRKKKGVLDRAPELVVHPKFGRGTVLRRIGEGDQAKLVIAFADGERTLLARFVQPATDAGD